MEASVVGGDEQRGNDNADVDLLRREHSRWSRKNRFCTAALQLGAALRHKHSLFRWVGYCSVLLARVVRKKVSHLSNYPLNLIKTANKCFSPHLSVK